MADLPITSTSPNPPFRIGERIEDPLSMYLSDILTVSANLAGICGISIPCGKTKKNLPIGLQILGPLLSEREVLQLAYRLERGLSIWRS
jgi:aspartyl-tRNA(Asn)/glutamyl-tRNA(Gln) amidotransferase subunit A